MQADGGAAQRANRAEFEERGCASRPACGAGSRVNSRGGVDFHAGGMPARSRPSVFICDALLVLVAGQGRGKHHSQTNSV